MTPNLPAWTALDSVALPSPSGAPGESGGVTLLVATEGAVEAGWAGACAVGLARSWATAGHRVVLADADVLAPTLHEELGLPNREGLSDVLLWGASVRRVAQGVEDGGFYLMSAGTVVADGIVPFQADRWSHLCDGFREAGVIFAVFTPQASVSSGPVMDRASEVVLLAEESEDVTFLAKRIGLPVVGVVGRRAGDASTAETEPEATVPDEPTDRAVAEWGPGESGQPEAEASESMEPGVGQSEPEVSESQESVLEPESRGVGISESAGGPPGAPDDGGVGERVQAPATEGTTDAGERATAEPQTRDLDSTGEGDSVATLDSAMPGAPRVPPLEEVLEEVVTPPTRPPRRRPALLLVLLVVLLGIVGAALLGYLRIPGIPQLLQAPAHSEGRQGSTAAPGPLVSLPVRSPDVTPVASHPPERTPAATHPAEMTPVARFDIALAAYKDATVAAARVSRLKRALRGVVFTSVPVQVGGTLFHRVLVGVAADSAEAAALAGRVARATGLSSASWVIRSTPEAFYMGETAEQEVAERRVEELERRNLPAYTLAVDYSDGSTGYRIYVGAFADRVEASAMSTLLRELGLDGVILSDRFGRLPE